MTNYDQWKTDDYSLQADRDDADHRLTEINSEIAELEDDTEDQTEAICDLETESLTLKRFLGITEF